MVSPLLAVISFLLLLSLLVPTSIARDMPLVGSKLVEPPSQITRDVAYGEIFELGNTVNPTGVVTLLHGLGDSARGMASLAKELVTRLPHLLFLVPSAANLPQGGGTMQRAWFSIIERTTTSLSTGKQDTKSLANSVDYVAKLTQHTCAKYRVHPDQVCIGGFSQGAAVAVATALTSPSLFPAGVFLMSGFLPAAQEVLAEHAALMEANLPHAKRFTSPERAMRFAMFHGTQDRVIHFAVAEETKALIDSKVLSSGGTVELHQYPMQHQVAAEELGDVVHFIASVLPAPPAAAAEAAAAGESADL